VFLAHPLAVDILLNTDVIGEKESTQCMMYFYSVPHNNHTFNQASN